MAEKKVILIVLSTVATLSAILVSFTASTPRPDSTLRIGYAVERPYAYLNNDGVLTGAFIETAEKISRRMDNQNLEWVQIRFDKLLSNLKQGHIDMIGSGMYLTPERDKAFDFSVPIVEVSSAIIMDKSGQQRIENNQDVPPLTIAVQAGSVEAGRLHSAKRNIRLETLEVPFPRTGLEALESGLSDGLYLSSPTLKAIQQRQQNKYEIIPESWLVGDYSQLGVGFIFNEDNDELRRAWNEAATDWIMSEEYIQSLSRFGFTQDNLP